MIKHFVSDVCSILGIASPEIAYDSSLFPTETTLTLCSPSENKIYLKCFDKPSADILFSIAHELRHLYQFQTDEKLYFGAYKPSNMCDSIEQYNLQLAEIDANAFAGCVMVDFFHLKPLFEGLPDSAKEKIYDRMQYICESF